MHRPTLLQMFCFLNNEKINESNSNTENILYLQGRIQGNPEIQGEIISIFCNLYQFVTKRLDV